jgi:DNA polymerase-3 subunit beta
MKLKGNRQRLLDAFTVVGSVVAPKSIKPILKNVRLVVSPEGATLLATDLEVAIRYKVVLDSVEEGGGVLLPSSKVLGILKESEGDEVEINSDGHSIELLCGNGRFKVLGEDPEEFPVVPSFDDDQSFMLQRELFRTLVKKTTFATAKERTRYAFNGVRFEVEGDEARMISTDGKRMAVKTLPIDNPDGLNVGRIIPTKGLQTFDRVLTEEDKDVQISLQEKQAMIKTSCAEVSSRLVEGAFPNYQAVIPKETPCSASFPRGELLSALRRAAILTNDESKSIKLSFTESNLTLTSRAIDVGESKVELATVYEGEPLDVAFNPDYLIEGIRSMDAESITLRLSGKNTAARVDGEESFIYVVMPVTLRTG